MITAGDFLACAMAGLLLVPLAMLSLEALAALLPIRQRLTATTRPRVAVLVPAHDEEAGLAATIARIRPQLRDDDRLLVIADNCTDGTAGVARTAGVEVLERVDNARRGKGFALDAGLRQLAADPPGVVIVIDADTDVLGGAIDALATAVAATGRPMQGLNLLDAPAGSGPGPRIASFAFFFKNAVRPRGLDRLGLPCLLYGTGMALPWDVVKDVDLAHGHITEDIQLGLELAKLGRPAGFCPEAEVRGELPRVGHVARGQRKRWEHGHLSTAFGTAPRLAVFALLRGRPRLFFLALHVGVPPLAFLFMASAAAAVGLWLFGKTSPAALVVGGIAVAVVSILATWARFGRDRLPARDLAMMPVYVLRKIPLYLNFFIKPQKAWVRTEREAPADTPRL